jgi:hypothetical protein
MVSILVPNLKRQVSLSDPVELLTPMSEIFSSI